MTQTLNTILLTNRYGRVRSLDVNPRRLALLALITVTFLCGAILYSGFRVGVHVQAREHYVEVAEIQTLTRQQRTEIADARESARTNLDALTLRVGRLQAEMLRLNVLGERLVHQADLDASEFDFNIPPPVGGPHIAAALSAMTVPDFLGMLDELDVVVEDREHKLTVLERLLMARNLRERVVPSGRPVVRGLLSSKFGKRIDPFTGKQEYHEGIDFAGKEGAEVIAAGDGVVTWSGERSGYGNLVEINHGNGYVTRYGHNREQLVGIGETVKKNQPIALLGSTGRSTGPHVHFEVIRDGKQVNPAKYLN